MCKCHKLYRQMSKPMWKKEFLKSLVNNFKRKRIIYVRGDGACLEFWHLGDGRRRTGGLKTAGLQSKAMHISKSKAMKKANSWRAHKVRKVPTFRIKPDKPYNKTNTKNKKAKWKKNGVPFLECSCKIVVFNAEGDNARAHTENNYRYLFLLLLALFPWDGLSLNLSLTFLFILFPVTHWGYRYIQSCLTSYGCWDSL